MTIMIILMAVGFSSFAAFDKDEVEQTGDELVQMSKFAVQAAATQGRSYVIAFDKDGYGILGGSGPVAGRKAVPRHIKMEIQHWGDKRWQPADGTVWLFGAQGLCEPIKVRISNAETSREIAFNPLTGAPSDY